MTSREAWLKKVDERAAARAREVAEAKAEAIRKASEGDLAAGVFLHELYPEEYPTDPRAAVGILARPAAVPVRHWQDGEDGEEGK